MKSLLLAIAASAAVALWTHTSRADSIEQPPLETVAIFSVTTSQ